MPWGSKNTLSSIVIKPMVPYVTEPPSLNGKVVQNAIPTIGTYVGLLFSRTTVIVLANDSFMAISHLP